jgi:hypothetical protein
VVSQWNTPERDYFNGPNTLCHGLDLIQCWNCLLSAPKIAWDKSTILYRRTAMRLYIAFSKTPKFEHSAPQQSLSLLSALQRNQQDQENNLRHHIHNSKTTSTAPLIFNSNTNKHTLNISDPKTCASKSTTCWPAATTTMSTIILLRPLSVTT